MEAWRKKRLKGPEVFASNLSSGLRGSQASISSSCEEEFFTAESDIGLGSFFSPCMSIFFTC